MPPPRAIARHAERPCDAAYAATLAQLEARWRTLAPHATAELKREVAQHLERAREALERHRQALAAEAERSVPPPSPPRRRGASANSRRRPRRRQRPRGRIPRRSARPNAPGRAHEAGRGRGRGAPPAGTAAPGTGGARSRWHGTRRPAARGHHARSCHRPLPCPSGMRASSQQVDARTRGTEGLEDVHGSCRSAPRLVERMQSLVGAEISPEELARQIRRLRDEWRTLHRGAAGEEPTPEWQQFDEAAERAYEPCREHFARQAEQRKENQARREALLERLGRFAAEQAGEQPNWRLIRQAIVRGATRVAAVRAGGPGGGEAAAGALPRAARRAAGAPRCRVRAQRAGEARHDRPRRRTREPRGHAPGHRGSEGPAAGLEDRRDRAATPGQRALGGVPAELRRRVPAQLAGIGGARRRARGQPGAGGRAVRRTGAHRRADRRAACCRRCKQLRRAVHRVRLARTAAGVCARPAPAVQPCDRPLCRHPYAEHREARRAPRLDRLV